MLERARWLRLAGLALASAMLLAGGGCKVVHVPRLPKPIHTIQAQVVAAELVERSDEAAVIHVIVELASPNEDPLPATFARYTAQLGDVKYSGDLRPNATMPADSRTQRITFPVVMVGVGDPTGQEIAARGSIEFQPAGEVRHLLSEWGVPRPSVNFRGAVAVTDATAD